MIRSFSVFLAVCGFAIVLTPGVSQAQNNPSGWIVTDGWNHALQFLNPFGAAPAPAVLKMNWVSPFVIGEEDPDGSDFEEWEVDFDASPSTGWDNGGLSDVPIWATTELLYETYPAIPMDGLSGTDPGLINIQDDFVTLMNTNLGPQDGLITPIPGDNVMSMHTTYVENTAEAPLLLDVCTASDDSLQVWINNKCVTSLSIARPSAANCQETMPAVLPVGVSKIAVLVWEGGGGHNFRLGLQLAGSGTNLADGNGMIEFLGPFGEGQVQYCADRVVVGNDPDTGCSTEARVTITGSGESPVAGDSMVTVCDQVTGEAETTISDVSNGGTVSDILASDTGIDGDTGAALEFFVLGPISNPAGAEPGEELIRAEYLTLGDGEVGELVEGDDVEDVDGTIQTVRRLSVNNGDALDFNLVGGAGDNILHYAWTKLTLTEPKDLAIAVNADDSVHVLLIRDGDDEAEEVTIHNGNQGFGGAGSAEWSGLVSLAAGTHTVLTKTFEGGSGHGVRLLFFDIPSLGIGPGGLDCESATEILPGQTGVGATTDGLPGLDCDPQLSRAHYYSVEGTGGLMRAETCSPVFLYDTYLAVFAGACDFAGCVVSNDDTCGRQSVVEWESEPGEVYFIRVYGWSARQGVYFLRVSDAETPAAAPIQVTPLEDSACADPDGDCDPAALTVVGRKITWTVTRDTLESPGVGYTISGANANLSGGLVSNDDGTIAIIGGDSSTNIIGEGEPCLPTKLPGLLGSDLTDIDDDGDELAFFPPEDLGGFDAEFFSSDEPGFGGGEFAFNVFDNVVGPGNDKWCCGTSFPQIVGADFSNTTEEEVSLTHFTVTSANDTPGRDPRVWRIEGSIDGEEWDIIFEQDDPSASLWGDTRNCTLLFEEGVHYPVQEEEYLMFRMVTDRTGLVGGAFFQIGEIEFFGGPLDTSGVGPFVRCDCNGDGTATGNPADAIFQLNWLFLGGPSPGCIAACDCNGDGRVIGAPTDAIYNLNFLFLGGPTPPEPNPASGCGSSSTANDVALGCDTPTC